MEESRPITHDPNAEIDLSADTVAAAQRVKYRIGQAMDNLMAQLRSEGLQDDPKLIWSLVGSQIIRIGYQMADEAAGIKEEDIPEVEEDQTGDVGAAGEITASP